MIKHRISKTEVSALAAAALFLIIGIYLGFTKDATLLNRAGSLIIICGVLLAATRFTEILSRRVDEFLKKNEKLLLNKIIENHESFFGTSLDEAYKLRLAEAVQKKHQETFSTYQNKRNREFKLYEIGIISFGTFVNGFGDLAIKAMSCVL